MNMLTLTPDLIKQQQHLINVAMDAGLEEDGIAGPLTDSAFTKYADGWDLGVSTQLSPLPVPQPPVVPAGLGALILTVAAPFVGLYETEDNTTWAMQGSSDRTEANAFKALLEGIGWQPPESYCIAAVKAWYKAAFAQAGLSFAKYDALLDLGVLDSFNRCNAAGLITKTPVPGAIMFMEDGSSGSGHGVLVRSLDAANGVVYTREANTSLSATAPASEQRDGGCVADKTRPYSFTKTSGLWCRGFLNPPGA